MACGLLPTKTSFSNGTLPYRCHSGASFRPFLEKIKTGHKGRFKFSGRGERIRTFDTLVPNQVLYQTELHPENACHYILIFSKCKYIFYGGLFIELLIYSVNIFAMIQDYTLHTHTIGFDGQDTIQTMVNRARELGFKTIGISNHFIVNPVVKQAKMYKYAVRGGYSNMYSASFDEVLSRFIPHYEELSRAQEQNPDIKILRGMEVDFFNNQKWRIGFEKAIKILNPDYLIGSAHFVEYSGTLLNIHDLKNSDEKTQDLLLSRYWDNVARAAESGLFTWMAHLDLPKKVGLGRAEKWTEFEGRAVQAISKSGTAIEINTSFYRPDCYEPYPSNRILKMAGQNNVPVLISDDAHVAKNIGRHFDEAQQLIKDLNLKTFCR